MSDKDMRQETIVAGLWRKFEWDTVGAVVFRRLLGSCRGIVGALLWTHLDAALEPLVRVTTAAVMHRSYSCKSCILEKQAPVMTRSCEFVLQWQHMKQFIYFYK